MMERELYRTEGFSCDYVIGKDSAAIYEYYSSAPPGLPSAEFVLTISAEHLKWARISLDKLEKLLLSYDYLSHKGPITRIKEVFRGKGVELKTDWWPETD